MKKVEVYISRDTVEELTLIVEVPDDADDNEVYRRARDYMNTADAQDLDWQQGDYVGEAQFIIHGPREDDVDADVKMERI